MLPIESLNHPLTDVLGWTLIHFLWQGTLIGVLTAIVLITMKNRSASARYVASVLGFGVMAVCPLVTAAILFAQTPTASPIDLETASVLPTPETPHFEPTTEPPPFEVVAAETSVVSESPTTTATPLEPSPQPSLSERIDHLAPWVTAAWFVGAALLSLRLLFSWFQVIRITRFGLEPVDKAIQHTFDSLCERMGLRRIVRVFESTLIAVPATVGWLRPIVLVPATAITGLSQEQLIAVLAHELAHVRRYDYAMNLAQGVVETLLFYHPAVWLLSKRIRTERENCCDDVAVEITGEPVEYVRALTQLAESSPVPRLATAATGGDLATRARRLLGQPTTSRPPKAAGLIGLVALGLLCVAINTTAATSNLESDPTASPAPQQEKKPEFQFNKNPKWIVAKHAIIYEGTTVVDWDQVKETAKQLQESGKPFYPEFKFTRGWHWQGTIPERHARYERLQDAVFALGPKFRIIGGLGATDRRGFDWVKTQADLEPNPAHRVIGRVLTPDGNPAANAQVVILPTPKSDTIQEVQISGPKLSKPLQENFATTNASGGFTAYPTLADDVVLILHRSGFLQTNTKRLTAGKAIPLKKWVEVRGSIEGGIDKQAGRLTAELGNNLQVVNGLIGNLHIAQADKYPITMPPSPLLRADRWIMKVGSIGAVPFKEWKTKPGDVVEINMKLPTANEVEIGNRLNAVRRREPRWFVVFDHSNMETYASQLDSLGIELGAYFADEERFAYLSNASRDKPSVRTFKAKTDRLKPPYQATAARRQADQKLFDKAGVDVSKAKLFYYFPKPIEEKLQSTAADVTGVKHYEIIRCEFRVKPNDTDSPFVATRFELEEWVEPDPKPAANTDNPRNALSRVQKKREAENEALLGRQKLQTELSALNKQIQELKAIQEFSPLYKEQLNRWVIRFGNDESQELYEQQIDHFEVSLVAYWPKSGRLTVLTQATKETPDTKTRNISKNRNLPRTEVSESHRIAELAIFKKAQVDAKDARILHCYPPKVIRVLLALERAFQDLPTERIQRTYFKVMKQPDGFKLAVTRQVIKPEPPIDTPLSTTPTWIIAKHTIIFEGKHVVKWKHVEESLAELATRKGEIKASFRFTRGAREKSQTMQQDIFKAMKGLPRNIPMSIGFNGRATFDEVRTQKDLEPDRKLRVVARAFTPDGKPASKADVAIIPPLNGRPEHYVYITGTSLRSKQDYDHTEAKQSGGFVIYPKAGSTILVTHESGYALITPAQLREKQNFRLQRWVVVSGSVFETPGYTQSIQFVTTPGPKIRFMYFDVLTNEGDKYEAKVPGGTVSVMRSVKADRGTSFGRGVAELQLKPGEKQSFDLKPMTEYEIEGFELDKKQSEARRTGKELSSKDQQRLLERLKIDLEKRKTKQSP